jgi:hypothetical protein
MRPWGLLRSEAISLLTALGVVLVASRVNRPRILVERAREAALEETIVEVELDTRTLRTTVESLAKRTRARLVIDAGLSHAIEEDRAMAEVGWSPGDAPVLQRFRDVRLGALLSRVADEWDGRIPLRWRMEGETVTLYAVEGQPALERRIYSSRKLTEDWQQWRALTLRKFPPPAPTRGGGGGGGGGLFGRGAVTDEQRLLHELFDVFRRHFDGHNRWEIPTVQIWGGWLLIEAPPETHVLFERFLAMMEQAASDGEGSRGDGGGGAGGERKGGAR